MSDTLFDSPHVRATDPDTSRAAAVLPRSSRVEQARRVLESFPNGLTDFELTEALGLPERRKPSVAKARYRTGAVDTGVRRTSPDGCSCIVWRLAS